jgi:hypothetical protein
MEKNGLLAPDRKPHQFRMGIRGYMLMAVFLLGWESRSYPTI